MLFTAQSDKTAAQKSQARSNIGAAPDGYGIGMSLADAPAAISTLKSIAKTGWYYCSGVTDGPAFAPTWVFATVRSSGDITIFAFSAPADGYIAVLRQTSDGWLPWEYLNPPMTRGVEYRTTERYLDKPVYVKLVDFGALPNSTTKTVATGITNMARAVGVQLNAPAVAIAAHVNITRIILNETGVSVDTKADMSGWTGCAAICRYTKTTD